MRRFTTVALISFLVMHATFAQSEKLPASDARSEQSQPNPKAAESRASTRIKGRVVAEGGRSVPDASILCFPVNIVGGNMQGTMSSLMRPTTTDADGKFEVTNLKPGAYTLSATSPGFVLSDQDSKAFYRPGDNAILTLVKGGVITGKVTNSSAEPIVGAVVRVVRVRESDEKPVRVRGNIGSQISDSMDGLLGPYKTDDRGIYRIYGLVPGYYQVAAGGRGAQGFSLSGGNAYDGDAPTYYPSSTLETAADVIVGAGDEVTGIDIRYRENRGHALSGNISIASGPMPQATSVLLSRASTGSVEATTVVLAGRNRFGFDTLPDGDYIVTAMGSSANVSGGAEGLHASVSQLRRVTMKGDDVSGVDLVLEPLASIAGRAVLDQIHDAKAKAECKDVRPAPLEGTVLSTRDTAKQGAVDPLTANLWSVKNTTPSDKGEFLISFLRPGLQRMDIQLPGESLYVKAITLPQSGPNAKLVDVAKNGLSLKAGDKLKDLIVTLSEGAAALRGKVVVGDEKKEPDVKLRVYLIPAEPESADEVLRYYEGEVGGGGSFSLSNLAPGKYWLVARELSDQERTEADADHKPLGWEAGGRTGLRFEGEASKKVVELTHCQLVSDYRLKYIPVTKASKPPEKKPLQ